ncbi:benzoate-CoA ligase family protein [Mycobacterium botniense]|uniref:Benzoate--CoA ligase n=1 Tax=Mycobacterium botniense TaxID=84962 RepID=A0A7I9Y115_9MYCO|nr:benzoate-CoA ligase family protein [Mycobacterium botniense]GFG75746.1 benzoate--CoA ligase [Mycobacterium botniense]
MSATSPHAVFNAADYLVDRHIREGHGTRSAVITPSQTLSYQDLADTVHRVAHGLHQLGARPGDRVMLCMADDVEQLTAILAAMYVGAVPVPVSTMLTGKELGLLLADSRAKVLCASTEFAAQVAVALAAAPEVTDVVFDAAPPVDAPTGVTLHRWDVLSCAEPMAAPYPTSGDSVGLWLYTSGTTGTPKAAMHRHRSIRSVAENYGVGVLGISPQDRCLSVAKLFFAYGIGNSCFFPFAVGATSVLERARATPASIAKRVRAAQPTLFFGVPTFYSSLLASDLPSNTFSSVRQGISAGEALPAVLFNRLRDRFGIEVLDGIGSTESLHIFLSNRPRQVRTDSAGIPVPGYEVQLRTDDGAVIDSTKEPGTLYLRGPSIAAGYWCRDETTRRVFQEGWLRTGDVCVRNDDGTYSCLGRSDDMLKASGIWVSPAEVEKRLLQHPAVAEAVVVTAPDEAGLDKPVACVVVDEGRTVDPEELIGWCRMELASFKRPRAVVMMPELPKTSTGKIRRNLLRERVAHVLTTIEITA